MGLDMYLTERVYVQNWNHTPEDRKYKVTVRRGGKIVRAIDPKKITYVILEAGYWRKANQIHKWFVDNVQDGNDDCKEYYLEIEQLKELKKVCKEVLEDNKLAEELLPVSEGFFFGNNTYDEHYFSNLRDTVKIIDDVLKLQEDESYSGGGFYYRASW